MVVNVDRFIQLMMLAVIRVGRGNECDEGIVLYMTLYVAVKVDQFMMLAVIGVQHGNQVYNIHWIVLYMAVKNEKFIQLMSLLCTPPPINQPTNAA